MKGNSFRQRIVVFRVFKLGYDCKRLNDHVRHQLDTGFCGHHPEILPFIMKLATCSRRFLAHACVVAALIVLAGWSSPVPLAGFQKLEQTDAEEDELGPAQLFVPAPWELVRPLARARKALEVEDYRTAVELLGDILASPQPGDYLQPLKENPWRSVSVHNQAHLLMGRIAREHRRDYELRYNVTARQLLEQAITEDDFVMLAKVSRSFFYTESGYHATLLLGHHYLESGQPVSAASCFQALVSDVDARQKYDPQVTVLLAVCQMLGGNEASASQVLEQLLARMPGARIRIDDQVVSLFTNSADAIPWLTELFGNTFLAGTRSVEDWFMFRGNAERNATSGTGFPLPYPRWYVPTVNEPRYEEVATELFRTRRARSHGLIPALQPIAVGNTIVVRSVDQMVGIDFRTGKRVWEFPAWERGSLLDEDRQSKQLRQRQTESWHIDQRLWRDHLYGQVASDGRHVFVIDQPGYAAPVNERTVMGRGIAVENPNAGRVTNELKAVDLARQGAFCWEVGGETGGRVPELAGCFFLGAPLVLGRELYVLAELEGEIRLVVLDQETGDLKWSQQIAAIDTALPVTQDRLRRLAGATPSFSNGVIVCPTSAYGVVAVDRSTRSLLWGAQYPMPYIKNLAKNARARQIQLRSRQQSIRSSAIDASATLADGRIIVTPLETDRVLCLDLLTGKSLWTPQQNEEGRSLPGRPIEDTVYIGCVYQGTILLVGKRKLRALSLESGETVWTIPLEKLGQPSGRGFLTGGRYYFPTSDSLMVEVDLKQAKISKTVETRRVLGNLICYQGDLISQSHDFVSVYRQAVPVQEKVQRYLEKPQGDSAQVAEIFLWQAQLQSQDGDLAAAVRSAVRAWQTTGKPRERTVMLDLILELMEQDYSAVRSYVRDYESELAGYGKLKYTTAHFRGLLKDGLLHDALTLLNESEFGVTEEIVDFQTVDRGALRIRLDAQLKKGLGDVIRKADAFEMETSLRLWTTEFAPAMKPDRLAFFVDLLGVGNMPFEHVMRLVEYYLADGQYSDAERILNSISIDEFDAVASDKSGWKRLAFEGRVESLRLRLFHDAGWHDRAVDQAAVFLTRLEKAGFKDPWTGEKTTGRRLASDYFDGETKKKASWDSWHYGQVAGSVEPAQATRRVYGRTIVYPVFSDSDEHAPENIRVEVNTHELQLIIRDASGNLIGSVPYRPNDESQTFYSPLRYSGNYAMRGNLLFFAYGYNLVAVDLNLLKARRNGLLWHKNLRQNTASDGRTEVRTGFRPQSVYNPWGTDRFIMRGRDEASPIGNFVVNANYVFFRIGNSIHAVDIMTGNPVWQRSDLNRPGWLVADENAVALLESIPESSTAGLFRSATLLDASTGEKTGVVDLSKYQKLSLYHQRGLNLVFTGQRSQKQSLTCVNLRDVDQEIWQREWPGKSNGVLRDPTTMVIIQPDGKLEYLELMTGRTRFARKIRDDSFRSFEIRTLQDHDLILVNKESPTNNSPPTQYRLLIGGGIGGHSRLFNGWVYCIDRKSKQLAWPGPVRLEYFSLPRAQPLNAPVLTLTREVSTGNGPRRGGENVVELHSLDLRDGRLVDVQRIRNWNLSLHRIQAMPDEHMIVHTFHDRKVTLELSGSEIPPAAPASLTNEVTLPQSKASFTRNRMAQERESQQQKAIRDLQKRNQNE